VLLNDCDDDRQREVAIWPPKQEVHISIWNCDRYRWNSNSKSWIFNQSVPAQCRYKRIQTRSNDIAYRISSNRSPRPLLVQSRQTPGLYSRPGLY